MSTEDQSRSEFEAWCTEYQSFPLVPDAMFPGKYEDMVQNIAWDAWQASRRTYRASVLEEAAKVCEGEYLNEPQTGTEDIAYDHAVRDCASAIRVLAAQTQKDKP